MFYLCKECLNKKDCKQKNEADKTQKCDNYKNENYPRCLSYNELAGLQSFNNDDLEGLDFWLSELEDDPRFLETLTNDVNFELARRAGEL